MSRSTCLRMAAVLVVGPLGALAATGVLAAPQMSSMSVAAAATPAPAPAYSRTSLVGDLLDNAEAKAVLVKYIPMVVADPRIEQARGIPLQEIAQYAPEVLTPEVLAGIDADLAKVQKK